MSEGEDGRLRLDFDGYLRLEFRAAKVDTDVGLLGGGNRMKHRDSPRWQRR